MNKFLKAIPIVAGILLGLLFVMSAVFVLFKLIEIPEIPENTPAGQFAAAFGPTGYMTFIKVLELLGGLLVAIPRTRNLGLLVLGPILVNILAYHAFVMDGKDLFEVPMLIIVALALYLLWVERKAFGGLVSRA
jgi:putative oxidoreductase